VKSIRPLLLCAFTVVLTSALHGSPSAADKSSAPGIARNEQLTGTVIAVDAKARTFDLLTGVGYALRVRRIQMPAQADVGIRRTEVPFSRITPGSIVRVDCRTVGAVATASRTELIQPPLESRKP
jgi:hypothetical protein